MYYICGKNRKTPNLFAFFRNYLVPREVQTWKKCLKLLRNA